MEASRPSSCQEGARALSLSKEFDPRLDLVQNQWTSRPGAATTVSHIDKVPTFATAFYSHSDAKKIKESSILGNLFLNYAFPADSHQKKVKKQGLVIAPFRKWISLVSSWAGRTIPLDMMWICGTYIGTP